MELIDKDPRFIRYVVQGLDRYKFDFSFKKTLAPLIRRCLEKNPELFSNLTQKQLQDIYDIERLMQDFPEVLEFASPAFKGDKDWLEINIKSWRAVLFIDDDLRGDFNFIKSLVNRKGIQMVIGADKSVLDRLSDIDWKELKAYFLKRPKLLKEVPVEFAEKLMEKVPDLLLCLGRQKLLNLYACRKYVPKYKMMPKTLLNIIFAAQYLPFGAAKNWTPNKI